MDQRLVTRLLLLCGALGPLLFVAVFLLEGAVRPGYNAWETTISTLSLGAGGWVQIGNFSLFGALMLCFAAGLKRVLRTGPGSLSAAMLLAIAGLGLIVAAFFVTDPILGYPPGIPANGPATLHGTIHDLASLIVFMAIPAACFVIAWRFARDPAWRAWALLSMATGAGILMLVMWLFASVTAATRDLRDVTVPPGLLERLFSVIGCGWISALALLLLSRKLK